jgi:hypothetical protein
MIRALALSVRVVIADRKLDYPAEFHREGRKTADGSLASNGELVLSSGRTALPRKREG